MRDGLTLQLALSDVYNVRRRSRKELRFFCVHGVCIRRARPYAMDVSSYLLCNIHTQTHIHICGIILKETHLFVECCVHIK